MKKAIIKLLSFIALLLLVGNNTPNAVFAADNAVAFKATNFQVDVKPEYDDPRTLVIISADLYTAGTETVKKDTPVSFIIPKGAQIGMACEISAQGGHDCQPYSSKDLGDGKVELSWKSSKDISSGQKYPVYLELYYDNGAVAPNKTFTYNLIPTYNIDSLIFSITQPKNSTNFQLDPPATASGKDQDGLLTYNENFSNKTPKDAIAIKVSYNKSDNTPAFDKPQVGDQQKGGQATPSSVGDWYKSPAVIIPFLLTIIVMAVLIIYAVRNPKQYDTPVPNQRQSKNTSTKTNTQSSVSSERKKLRQALLDGRISEQMYKELLKELDD